jgi:hypothetical protein
MEVKPIDGNSDDMKMVYHPGGAYTYKSLLGQPPPCAPLTVCETHTVTNSAAIIETKTVQYVTYTSRAQGL